jgi:hypothetical protein
VVLRDGREAAELGPGVVGGEGPGDGPFLCIPLRFEGRDLATLETRGVALGTERHAQRRIIPWPFTIPTAHRKLVRLYPDVKTQLD